MKINPKVGRFFGQGLLEVKKHSPILLTTVGVVGVVTAGVLAARATLKLEDTLDNNQKRLDLVTEDPKLKTRVMVRNVFDITKLYLPSVTLGAASLVCIISAHGIMHKRNAALALAYKGLEETYNKYRARVVEEYGEEVDRDFHLGLRNVEVEDENGKKVTVKVPSEDSQVGEYVFLFGPDNKNWSGHHEHNEFFLQAQENYLNDLLRLRGYVMLNEVLERLGFEATPTGAITGWIHYPENQIPEGVDNYINFRAFPLGVVGQEDGRDWFRENGVIMLDFNVEGLMYDKLGRKNK